MESRKLKASNLLDGKSLQLRDLLQQPRAFVRRISAFSATTAARFFSSAAASAFCAAQNAKSTAWDRPLPRCKRRRTIPRNAKVPGGRIQRRIRRRRRGGQRALSPETLSALSSSTSYFSYSLKMTSTRSRISIALTADPCSPSASSPLYRIEKWKWFGGRRRR